MLWLFFLWKTLRLVDRSFACNIEHFDAIELHSSFYFRTMLPKNYVSIQQSTSENKKKKKFSRVCTATLYSKTLIYKIQYFIPNRLWAAIQPPTINGNIYPPANIKYESMAAYSLSTLCYKKQNEGNSFVMVSKILLFSRVYF